MLGRGPRWLRFAAYSVFAIVCVAVAAYAITAALARPRAFGGDFYSWLRFSVCGWAIVATAFVFNRFRNASFLVFVGLAVLFNPLRPFFLSKGTWSIIDLGVGLLSIWVVALCWRQLREQSAKR